MEEEIKQRLTSKDIWIRALYMVFFTIAYAVAETVTTLLVIFQFLAILFTGHANEPLLRLGNNLSIYIRQILQFVTFNSETRPFPFSDWPDEDHTGDRWLDSNESDSATEEPAEKPTSSEVDESDVDSDDESDSDKA